MQVQSQDIRTLQRGGAPGAVPAPRTRWVSRVLVPCVILFAAGGTLAYAARDALSPRIQVHVAAVVPKPSGGEPPTAPEDAAPSADGIAQARQVIAQAPGWIEPAPFPIAVPALAEGVVREVLVLEGAAIEAGQVVARLIDEDARLGLRAADARVAERTAEVAREEAALATAESLVRIEELSASELRDEVTRKHELLGIGGVSEGEFRRLEIRLATMEARVGSAARGVDEARAAIARARAALDAAGVDKDAAALTLSRTEVRSPVAGVVIARLVEPGSRVSMNAPAPGSEGGMSGAILRIYDPTKLQVRVDVPISDAAGVGLGTQAIVTTEALPGTEFRGLVSRVVHEANIQRNTVQFKVAIEAPSPVLKPEMLTKVKLFAPTSGGQAGGSGPASFGGADGLMLLIPAAALVERNEDKGTVWVVDRTSGQPRSLSRGVSVAPSNESGFALVISGLGLSDRVIIDHARHPGLKDGSPLRVIEEQATDPGESP